jgi:two-component system sensor histidine kinase KdpD
MDRVWVVLASEGGSEHVLADSGGGSAPRPAAYSALQRMPGDLPPRWTRVRNTVTRNIGRPSAAYRVNVEAAGRTIGALWASREPHDPVPTAEETRMLAAAADQIGQTLEQDRLRDEATSAELARQSDALKSALLDSVSHDLRTPLASIRAAAGSLLDRSVAWSEEDQAAILATIDREAERLNGLVTNLLDMSRIEAGGLRGENEPYQLDDLVSTAVSRVRPQLGSRRLEIEIPAELPLVRVDATFVDQALTNVLENAVKYTPDEATIRIVATAEGARVRLAVEDSGPGVPAGSLARLFDKFYRVPRRGEGARRGTGIGLTVVRGLVEAMGGSVTARPSDLGGLAIELDLPTAPSPIASADAHVAAG